MNLTGTLNNANATFTLSPAIGAWDLDGGTINSGTITSTGGSTLALTDSAGTLAGGVTVATGTTLDGTQNIGGQQAYAYVTGGLTLNGAINLGSASGSTYGRLYFENGPQNAVRQRHGDARHIDQQRPGSLRPQHGGHADHRQRHHRPGRQRHRRRLLRRDSVVNDGRITAASGQTLTIDGSNWVNAGTITANGATVNLGGSFTTAALGSFSASGSTVNLTGTLNNANATFTLSPAIGAWDLDSGTINSGTITSTGGSTLALTDSAGTLAGGVTVATGTTLDGTQNIGGQQAYAYVTGGLTLNGAINLGSASGSTYGRLYFENGPRTLSGNGTVTLGTSTNNVLEAYGPNTVATLTIGSGITVQGGSGTVGGYYGANSVVNDGTIQAGTSGGTITVEGSAAAFLNSGTVERQPRRNPHLRRRRRHREQRHFLRRSHRYARHHRPLYSVCSRHTQRGYRWVDHRALRKNVDQRSGVAERQPRRPPRQWLHPVAGSQLSHSHICLGDRKLLRRERALFRGRRGLQSHLQPQRQPHRPRSRGRSRVGGTQTTVQSSENPSKYGDTVSFTATVAPTVSTYLVPTGQVTFYEGSTAVNTATLVNGSATYVLSTLAAGTYSITVQYGGDSNFSGSTSTAPPQTVNPGGSQTSLQSSENPSNYGNAVTFTATVSPTSSASGIATPTGQVEFFDGSTLLDTATLSGGTASYTTSSLPLGANQQIEAKYLGDTNYNPSNVTIPQTVNTPPLTDFWTGASAAHGGNDNWSNPGNWALGAPPTAVETADFTGSESQYSTSIVDTSFSIANLTIDSTWGGSVGVESPLTISGNLILASGTLGGNGAISVAGSGSQFSGGTLNAGSGGFTNSGTLMGGGQLNGTLNTPPTVSSRSPPGPAARSITGNLTNLGAINVGAGTDLAVNNTSTPATFLNEGQVTVDPAGFMYVSQTYNAAGGTITGPGYVYNGTLLVTVSTASPITILVGGGTTLATNNLPNTTIWVQGNAAAR